MILIQEQLLSIAGIPGRDFVAGHIDRNLVRGVPIPEFLQTLEKAEKFALPHSIEIPMPPETAMTGVAFMMNRPADQAMYVAINAHSPRRVMLDLFRLVPRQRRTKAHPIAIRATIGPYDANSTPLSGACASPIVLNILFFEK